MKNFAKHLSIILCIISILLSLVVIPASAATTTYSTNSNSGKRDEVCTSLSGTNASSYYTGSYTFDNLSTLSSTALYSSLQTLMTHDEDDYSSYSDCKNMADKTDCEQNNGKITMIYTSYQGTQGEFNNGNGWNREHVWPKSLGGYETSGPGADLHHIRPSENKTNTDRGSLKYGEVGSGTTSTGNLSGLVGGTKGSYYEPVDNAKGDVARICLYMYVRYGSNGYNCGSITTVFQSVDVLLEWCELDPVDTWEMGRNEVIAAYQGNRNVFIDYPEYAWLLFGRSVPTDMPTPSGEASGGTITPGTNTGSGTGSGDNTGSGDTSTDGTPKYTVNPVDNLLEIGAALTSGSESSKEYYVLGEVTSDPNSTTGACTISDGTGTLSVGTLTDANGTAYGSISGTKAVKGNTVILSGKLKNEGDTVKLVSGKTHKVFSITSINDALSENSNLASGGSSTSTYFINATITDTPDATYGDCNISDGTGTLYIYGLCSPDGTQYNSISGNKAQKDDNVIVSGVIKNYNSTIELYKAKTLVIYNVVEDTVGTGGNTGTGSGDNAGSGDNTGSGDGTGSGTASGTGTGSGTSCKDGGTVHNWNDWITTTDPTLTSDGQAIRTCKDCTLLDVKTLEYSCTHETTEVRDTKSATCGEDGYSGDTYCTVCGARTALGTKIDKTDEHSFGEWVTTKEPTGTMIGERERSCSACEKKEYDILPMVEADYTPVIVGTSVGGVSVIGIALFFILRRRFI